MSAQNNETTYDTRRQIIVKRVVRYTFVYTILTFFALLVIIPFYWMILTSLMTPDKIASPVPVMFLRFRDMQFGNYYEAMFAPEAPDFIRYMANTVLVAAISTVGTIITTILSAFAFARLNFKFKELFFLLLIATMMIPGEMFVITNFITVSRLGWVEMVGQQYHHAILAMTLPFMTSIFYIFFLRQTFKQVPDELYYAAKVDGTKDFQYLWKIMVPIARPTIITILILNAMGTWNAFIWPNLVATRPAFNLVSNGLREFATAIEFLPQEEYIGQQMAAAFVITFPILVVFFLLKKHIMRGVSRSGIKG